MIPTLILWGLVSGRWWRFSVIAASVGWPVALVATEVIGVGSELIGAAILAAANTFVGVIVHQAALWGVRRGRAALASANPDEPVV
jgi:hypothetical protein